MNGAYLEPFYGGAARSMSMSWHDFVFGAADPWGTVSVDKLPGALWMQALSLRIFGFHVWALVLPQVVEGMLTVLVLYRAVRRVAGAGAGITAAVVMACSPIVILLDRGNISDSLLILLLVLAADATIRAVQTGRLRSLVWAGVLVGLAFQAKMLQAWLVLPALFLAYLVAAPVASFLRRVGHVALATFATVVVSLSWMSAVSLVPTSSRPYVDGSCNDSLFAQVFSYNGLSRLGGNLRHRPGCNRPSTYLVTAAKYSTPARLRHLRHRRVVGPAATRPLRPRRRMAAASRVGGGGVALRAPTPAAAHRPPAGRGDPVVRLARGDLRVLQRQPLLELVLHGRADPAVAALCGMGFAAAWHRRRTRAVRGALAVLAAATVAVTVALVPGYVGVRPGSSPPPWWSASWRSGSWWRRCAPATTASGPSPSARCWPPRPCSLGSAWASSLVVHASLGPFDSPYAPVSVNHYSQEAAARFPADDGGAPGVRGHRPGEPGGRRVRDLGYGRLLHHGDGARVPTRWRVHRTRARAVAGRVQAPGRRGPRPAGDRHHESADSRPRPALGGVALCAPASARRTTPSSEQPRPSSTATARATTSGDCSQIMRHTAPDPGYSRRPAARLGALRPVFMLVMVLSAAGLAGFAHDCRVSAGAATDRRRPPTTTPGAPQYASSSTPTSPSGGTTPRRSAWPTSSSNAARCGSSASCRM